MTSFDTILPLFVHRTFHWDAAAAAGAISLPPTLPSSFGPAIGGLSDRFGPRKVALIGFALALLGVVRKSKLYQMQSVMLCGLLVLHWYMLVLVITRTTSLS